MTETPSAIDANITARCEIDLSPGRVVDPEIRVIWEIFIAHTLQRRAFTNQKSFLKLMRALTSDVGTEETERSKQTEMKTLEFRITSHIKEIDGAVESVLEFCTSIGFDDESLFNIDIPLREALANAIEHGNRSSDERFVMIFVDEIADGVEIRVRDFGSGFDPEKVADPTQPENLLASSGRGILFMRTMMDSVEWEQHPEGGTVVRMIKKRL